MQGMKLFYPVHVPGTLTANVAFRFRLPFDVTLEEVQASASNASSATIIVGNSSDDDAYLAVQDVGDSGVPARWDREDFVGTQPVHIGAGTVVLVNVDYDGAAGTAAQNLGVLLVFSEG